MTLFDFARKNITRDSRNYVFYFANCVFSVFVFFLFTVLSFHPAMSVIDEDSTMGLILTLGEAVSVGFSVCFISYSVSCFLKSRSQQFGLITILGASKKQLNKLIFLENAIVGFASIVSGITLGLVFSKFFLDIANEVIGVSDFTFYFPTAAIAVTAIAMGLVFLGVAFFTPRLIRKKDVVCLLKAEMHGEKSQKLLPPCIAFLLLAAYVAWVLLVKSQLARDLSEMMVTPLAMLLALVIGTYLLFALGMRAALFLSRGSHAKGRLLYSSDMQAKIGANTRAMTISAVLYAISFFAITILFSMSTNVKAETEKIMPYAMSYNAWTENADVAGDLAAIEGELGGLPGYRETSFDLWYGKTNQSRAAVMSASDYNALMRFLGRKTVTVSDDGVFLVAGNAGESIGEIPAAMQEIFKECGITLSVEGNSDALIALSGFTSGVCVVSDSTFDTLLPQLKSTTTTAFLYDGWETNGRSPAVISDALKPSIESRDANVVAAYSYYRSTELQNNLTLYIGGMLCFTFFLAVASFVYSRLYSELEAECQKYRSIVKIGLSKKELSAALNRVTSLIVLAPFLVAVAYLWIGIAISERHAIISNIPVALWCTVVLFALEAVLSIAVNISYRKAVFRKVYRDYERA